MPNHASPPRIGRVTSLAAGLAILAVCVILGLLSVVYGLWIDDKLIRILAIPGVLALLFFFFADNAKSFLAMILVRAPIDPLLQAIRVGPMTPGVVMNALMLVTGLLMFIKRPRTVSHILFPMWLPLIVVMLVAAVRAPDHFQGVRTFMAYMTNVAVFIVPFYLKQCQKDMTFCARLILLSSVIPALYGFVDYALGGMGGVYGNRIASTLGHANIFAFYLVLVMAMALYLLKSPAMKTSHGQRVLLGGYMCVLGVLLVLTQTRSAWAACLVLFVVYGLLFERRYLVYIAVAGGAATFVPAIQDRLMDAFVGGTNWSYGQPTNSYEWRKVLWESAWNYMRPSGVVVGYGLNAFAFYTPDFFQLGNRGNWSAHSVYMQWLFETGIVGLLCAAWLYYRLLSLLKTGIREDRLGTVIVMTVVIEYLVFSYADNMLDYLAFNWYYWFVLGTACSIVVTRRAEAEGRARAQREAGEIPGNAAPEYGLTARVSQ